MTRFAVSLLTLLAAACAGPFATRDAGGPVTVGIVAFNDFHGNLEQPRAPVVVPDGKGGTAAVPAGGAAWLASAITSLRAKYRYSATVSAGDLIGASPIASSLFLDEPTVGAMNRIGLDFNAVGNHEFDRGRKELLRMQRGGCDTYTMREPCRIERFSGARFGFLAASTFTGSGKTLFPATGIRRFGEGKRRVTVGFIGLTLKGTPSLVSPDGIAGLTFGDEADAINAVVPKLKARGADAVVVLIHQGGYPSGTADPSGCDGLDGAIVPILARLDPRVDAVVSGHTHQAYICDFGATDPARPFLLTSAGFYGRLVTDIALAIDPATDRVVAKSARNVIVDHAAFGEDGGIAAYVRLYTDAVRDHAMRTVGRLSGPAGRSADGMGGTLGDLIADAQLAATRSAGAQIAFTNPFGIRAALEPAADGSLTFGQIYAVQPFGNALVTQTLTGAELRMALEQCLDDVEPEQLLAPSAGFFYRFDRSRPAGQRIVEMTLDGEPVRPDAAYRVTTNSFLAQGGDGFSALSQGRDAVTGGTDLDALEAWLKAEPARKVPAEQRVVGAGS